MPQAVATSPDVDVYGTENAGLASVEIPTMVMAQSSDDLFSLERVISVYEHLASTEKALVEFENAGHTIFMNPCEVTPWFPEFTSPWVCSDAVWDVQRAHDLINHFTTMFLLAELYGDADTSAALSPEEVEFSGMDYQAGGSARSLVASADAPVRVWGAQDDPARDRRPDPMGEPRRFS